MKNKKILEKVEMEKKPVGIIILGIVGIIAGLTYGFLFALLPFIIAVCYLKHPKVIKNFN